MNKEVQIKSIWKLIILHLLPGLILTVGYIVLLQTGFLTSYPKLVVFSIAGLLSIVPFELGYLFYVAKKESGRYNLFVILGLKNKMPLKKFIAYVIGLFLITGLLMSTLSPVSVFMENQVFNWIPSWYSYVENMSQFSQHMLIITIVASLFFATLIGPIVEELYFRGLLLSRMNWMGNYSVIVNSALFAIYHFWSPWLIVTRTIAFLPLFYIVRKKDSLRLAIVVHCLANLVDVIVFMTLLK